MSDTQGAVGHEAVLVLEDGRAFHGRPFGAVEKLATVRGAEVVFATSMTGYQEICTDPSYRGQMVALTNPIVGAYGTTGEDDESARPWLAALIVREACDEYSNWRAEQSLSAYLAARGIPGLAEVDTRALTRHLRERGTLRGVISTYAAGQQPDPAALAVQARAVRSVTELDVVAEVAASHVHEWDGAGDAGAGPRVLLIDTGFKHHIARMLARRGLRVLVAPHTLDLGAIRRLRPDGIVLSNGPGDPANDRKLVELTRALLRTGMPLLGICLGHQVISLAAGATTSRLPFGHHGANHPIRDVRTGQVTITAQNHNFQVDAASLPRRSGFYVSHVNLSDGSVEGLAHESLPVLSVQFHPEASPGPQDNHGLFDRFACWVQRGRAAELAG